MNRNKNYYLLVGILYIVSGLIFAFSPLLTLATAAMFSGILITVASSIGLYIAFKYRSTLGMIVDILGLLFGLFLVGNVVFAAEFIVVLIGLYIIIGSIVQLVLVLNDEIIFENHKTLICVLNGVNLVFGFFIVTNMLFGASVVGYFIAFSFILKGIEAIVLYRK